MCSVRSPWMIPGNRSWSSDESDRVLWRTLTKKNVVDFSKWKSKAFERAYEKLVRGLKYLLSASRSIVIGDT